MLAKVGLMVGWLSDEITGRGDKNSLQIAWLLFLWQLTKVQCYYSVTNVVKYVFLGKAYCMVCCGGA